LDNPSKPTIALQREHEKPLKTQKLSIRLAEIAARMKQSVSSAEKTPGR
jgi:hypothetical protein